MFSWVKRLFKRGINIEWPFLARYTVHAIACEVCGKPLKDGDILVRFDTFRDTAPTLELCKKVAETVVFAHVECLVVITERGTGPVERMPHRRSLLLTQDEYDNWLEMGVLSSAQFSRANEQGDSE